MKAMIAITIVVFACLLFFQNSWDSKENQIEKTININEEIISTYEQRIKSGNFKDSLAKKNYVNGYSGFLNWVNEIEYKELDEEFRERVEKGAN